MQNPKPKFRQNSITYKKPGYFPVKLKISTSSNYHELIFFAKFCTRFLLNNVYKRVFSIFISSRSWVINKNAKNLVSVSADPEI